MSARRLCITGISVAATAMSLTSAASPTDKATRGAQSAASSSCDPATEDQCALRLPIKIVDSNPVTEIVIGGRPIQAIVDTGGGAIALSQEAILGSGGVRLKEDQEWSDALGNEYRVPRFKVPQIGIGGRIFRDVSVIQATAEKTISIQNAIGGQFLSGYITVVDYAGLSMTLWPVSAKDRTEAACGRTSIPMERTEQSDLAVVRFTTPSGALKLLLDTGATYSVLPDGLVAALGLDTFRRGDTPFYGPVELSGGGRTLMPLEFVVLPLRLPDDFDGMLGANFFMKHVVCLDYQRREVRVR